MGCKMSSFSCADTCLCQINNMVLANGTSFQLPNQLFKLPERPLQLFTWLTRLASLSNLRTLQKSTPTSADGEEWQERPLCLGSPSTCGSMLMGHILGFGEDEIGEWCVVLAELSLFCHCCICVSSQNNCILYATFKCVQTKTQKCVEIAYYDKFRCMRPPK